MATALRPIAHEDRLSLVEHLDELRTRIIICLVGLSVAFAFCFWQNDAILEILDRPLEKSAFTRGSEDPLERTAAFQQAQKRLYLQQAVLAREMARSDDLSPELRARWAELARMTEATANAAPRRGTTVASTDTPGEANASNTPRSSGETRSSATAT